MKKNLIEFFIFVIFLSLLIFPNIIKIEILESLKIFVYVLFPSIFPMFLISDLLISYDFPKTLNKYLNPLISKIFHVSGASSFIIIMSTLTGFPSSAKNIKTLLDTKQLTLEEANYLIIFTHFANPLFVITITKTIFNDLRYSYLILITMYLANFIIGFIIRPKKKQENIFKINTYSPNSFSSNLTNAINKSFSLLMLILGSTCFFFIVSRLIIKYLSVNGIIKVFINGFFDLTNGINSIKLVDVNNLFKSILILTFISFGGLNIIIQIISILENTKIKLSHFFLGRICEIALSSLLFILLYNIFIKTY